ncbi:glutaredoxin [Woeseiaceae bacterium]|nr:glutaredoxin [Woeseiaceae bacterium]
MIKKILRRILGRMVFGNILKLINFLTLPKPIKRNSKAQKLINLQTDKVALYQFGTCPFCIKVTRFIHQNSLNIELRNTRKDPDHKTDLVNLGGKYQVPCLRIAKENEKDFWLYESDEIISYFKKLT